MDVSTNKTADDAKRAREVEYGTYVATEQIYVNGALAFNTGDPVPVSTVKRLGLSSGVRKVTEDAKSTEDPKSK